MAQQLPLARIKHTCLADDVYSPAEDSFILVDALALTSSAWSPTAKLCVEIGSGSGYVVCSLALLLKHHQISAFCWAVDINPAAVAATKQTLLSHQVEGVDVICGDLLTPLLPRLQGCVDLLVFNPPYVPTPAEELKVQGIAQAWAGGPQGRVVIDRLLAQLDEYLAPAGQLFMVVVEENDPMGLLKALDAKGFAGSIVLSRRADQESLHVLRILRA